MEIVSISAISSDTTKLDVLNTYNLGPGIAQLLPQSTIPLHEEGLMKISRIRITNFRSIKNLDFAPGNLCALVGENSVGKTNVLAALEFLLGETWPSRKGLDDSDYFNHDTNSTVGIYVQFAENPAQIHSVWFRAGPDREERKVRYYADGQYDTPAQPLYLNQQAREKCALVFVGAERSLDYHLSPSQWRLFGRIIRELDAQFPEEHRTALEGHFNSALEVLKTDQFIRFEQELRQAFAGQVQHIDQTLGVDFRAFDPLSYYRSLHLLLLRDADQLPMLEVGQGMRNFALLALFRAYAKVFKSNAVIAIEEPEIYLHPHAQRSLAALFKELAAQDNQVFYSTHSAHFVDAENFENICLVERCPDEEGDICTQVRHVSLDEFMSERRRIHPGKSITDTGLRERIRKYYTPAHSEAFFARKIVLVEGETEEFSLPIFANFIGYNFDAHGVSIVNCGSKTEIDLFYQLYTAFRKQVYVIFDNDRGAKDKWAWNETLLTMLGAEPECLPEGRIEPFYAVLEGNFETEMKMALGEEKYLQLSDMVRSDIGPAGKGLKARYEAKLLVDEGQSPDFITKIIEAIRRLGEPLEDELDDIPF